MTPKKSLRPKMRPKDLTPEAESGDSDLMKIEGRTKIKEKDMTPEAERGDADLMRLEKGYKDGGVVRGYENGGVVRGCKSMQSSGKGFRGTY